MNNTQRNRFDETVSLIKSGLITTAAASAFMIAGLSTAQAQTVVDTAETDADADAAIVVTGSRIAQSGFSAPSPVTVVSTQDFQQAAAVNVADVLNDLPSFRSTTTPKAASLGQSGAGLTALDLRGLGATRTLVLVNGRRFVPSNSLNIVDVSLIPTLLLERTEVVTGGASAAYGSDAVAGVVNLILKKRMNGIEGTAQYGISSLNDGENYLFGLSGGMDVAGGRGNITLGAEYSKDDGLDYRSRERRDYWIRGRGRVGTPDGFAYDTQYANQFPGGVITGPNIPAAAGLIGTTFGDNGTTGKLLYGDVYGGTMIGGGQPGNNFDAMQDLQTGVERYSFMGRFDYQLTNSINFNIELSQARTIATGGTSAFRDGGSSSSAPVPAVTSSLVARIDNPYLPTSVRDQMIAAGLSAVYVGRSAYATDFSITDPRVTTRVTSLNRRLVVGLDGELGSGNWKWDAYYQYGRTKTDEIRPGNRIPANYRLAVDVVADPITGDPVCRSTLTDPSNGCVPFNIFGPNSASDAARAYVTGTAMFYPRQTQHVAAANLQGDIFNLPAGPLAVAFGAEYRVDKANATSDANSMAFRYEFSNSQPYDGKVTVKEAYVELLAPILADSGIIQAMDVNLAARLTDYSTSGTVVTWKAGTTVDFTNGLRLRGTLSRDIRAPNISELFAQATAGAFFVPDDKVLNIPTSTAVATVTASNPNLSPERSTTYTFGAAYQPDWFRGLRLSVDYFNISIKDQVARVGGQTIIDRCADGITSYCGFIVRDPITNIITAVNSPYLNLNNFKTSGIDFEASLNRPLADLSASLPGNLGIRLLATYTKELSITDAAGTLDLAGQLRGTGTYPNVPHWLGNATISYDVGQFSSSIKGRYVGSGTIDNYYTTNINHVSARSYWDMSLAYDLMADPKRKMELFGVVENVFDSHPPFPFMPSSLIGSPYHTDLGRAFRIGVRFVH